MSFPSCVHYQRPLSDLPPVLSGEQHCGFLCFFKILSSFISHKIFRYLLCSRLFRIWVCLEFLAKNLKGLNGILFISVCFRLQISLVHICSIIFFGWKDGIRLGIDSPSSPSSLKAAPHYLHKTTFPLVYLRRTEVRAVGDKDSTGRD